MNKANTKNPSLRDLFNEVRALRRDVLVFMPTESFDGYRNKKEILAAHRDARKQIARAKLA